jgi:hypothetical protein
MKESKEIIKSFDDKNWLNLLISSSPFLGWIFDSAGIEEPHIRSLFILDYLVSLHTTVEQQGRRQYFLRKKEGKNLQLQLNCCVDLIYIPGMLCLFI